MSNRAVRKLHGAKDDLSVLAINLQLEEDPEENDSNVAPRNNKKKTEINLFDLVLSLSYYKYVYNCY